MCNRVHVWLWPSQCCIMHYANMHYVFCACPAKPSRVPWLSQAPRRGPPLAPCTRGSGYSPASRSNYHEILFRFSMFDVIMCLFCTWNAWLVLTMILLCFLSVPVIINMWFKLHRWTMLPCYTGSCVLPWRVVDEGIILVRSQHVPSSCFQQMNSLLVDRQPKRLWPV